MKLELGCSLPVLMLTAPARDSIFLYVPSLYADSAESTCLVIGRARLAHDYDPDSADVAISLFIV